MGVLQREFMPKLCFVMVLTISRNFLQIVMMFCHDLTDMSCSRLTLLLIFTGCCCCCCLLFVVVVCFVLVCFVSC